MNYIPTTIGQLFDSKISFSIPVYQRAYSWDDTNWTAFLDDIIEQLNQKNGYSYGSILLEVLEEGVNYEVIDGQQRLTTLIIFMRALIDSLALYDDYNKDKISDLENDYIYRKGIIKLRPVESDRPCFDAVIIQNTDYPPTSPSQARIISAKKFFKDKLRKYDLDTLIQIKEIISKTKINRLELQGKKESALMFELQNNRGKDLTNLEKLKSYFMYQMFVNSTPEETDANVENVSNNFKEIYRTIYDIKGVSEDSILIYHCNAYLDIAFAYRNLDDIKKEYKAADNKVVWIKEFTLELAKSFKNLKTLQTSSSPYFKNMKSIGRKETLPAFVYPFIIKGYKYFGNDDEKINKLLHIMEILTFRYYLIGSRAELNSRLKDIIINFNGDLNALRDSIKNKLNETWHWGDKRIGEYLKGWMYENPVLHYLLWQYEGFIQSKGYSVGLCEIENEQIEHISPQTPPEGESLATGYDVNEENKYSTQFLETELNCLGNLMLISGSHNASIGNKPFADKLKSYISNPLLKQQAEIPTFLNNEIKEWKTEQIEVRKTKIVEFAISRWSFDNVQIKQ